MKRRSTVALSLVVVLAAALTAATSGATKRAAANNITVWLQVDAQSGWPDLVASVNKQFQSDHPGVNVNVQYQNWGDHLQKFDATIAGNSAPDVIEMGNTEMTKYMAAGAFAPLDKSQFDNSSKSIAGLTAYKKFFDATSHASRTTDETHPNPYDVYAQGGAASMIGPSWFTCCVGAKFKTSTAQFVMPGHVKGQSLPGFLGG